MALETPNQTIASAVLLFQNFIDPPNETVEFASNAGFQSVAFIDPADVTVGVVLELSNPVNNQEGQVVVGGEPDAEALESPGYITPNHNELDPTLDALEPNQVAIIDIEASVDVFRMTVQVLGQQAILPPDPNEPVAP